MGYRGLGGYSVTPIIRRAPRRAAGDWLDDFDPSSIGSAADFPPDFSDVMGGSSTVDSDAGWSTMGLGDLGNFGGAISKFLGGAQSLGPLAGPIGSAAAAGGATLARGLKKWIGPRMGSRRRMNPGNFRALRRAMHRLSSFEKAARKVVHFTHPKPNARVKFKFRRRRKR